MLRTVVVAVMIDPDEVMRSRLLESNPGAERSDEDEAHVWGFYEGFAYALAVLAVCEFLTDLSCLVSEKTPSLQFESDPTTVFPELGDEVQFRSGGNRRGDL